LPMALACMHSMLSTRKLDMGCSAGACSCFMGPIYGNALQ
jgi:hypothetical protein